MYLWYYEYLYDLVKNPNYNREGEKGKEIETGGRKNPLYPFYVSENPLVSKQI